MKEKLLKLIELGFDLNDFYVVTIYSDKTILQGNLDSVKKYKYEELGYDFILGDYFEATKDNIVIVLTF